MSRTRLVANTDALVSGQISTNWQVQTLTSVVPTSTINLLSGLGARIADRDDKYDIYSSAWICFYSGTGYFIVEYQCNNCEGLQQNKIKKRFQTDMKVGNCFAPTFLIFLSSTIIAGNGDEPEQFFGTQTNPYSKICLESFPFNTFFLHKYPFAVLFNQPWVFHGLYLSLRNVVSIASSLPFRGWPACKVQLGQISVPLPLSNSRLHSPPLFLPFHHPCPAPYKFHVQLALALTPALVFPILYSSPFQVKHTRLRIHNPTPIPHRWSYDNSSTFHRQLSSDCDRANTDPLRAMQFSHLFPVVRNIILAISINSPSNSDYLAILLYNVGWFCRRSVAYSHFDIVCHSCLRPNYRTSKSSRSDWYNPCCQPRTRHRRCHWRFLRAYRNRGSYLALHVCSYPLRFCASS